MHFSSMQTTCRQRGCYNSDSSVWVSVVSGAPVRLGVLILRRACKERLNDDRAPRDSPRAQCRKLLHASCINALCRNQCASTFTLALVRFCGLHPAQIVMSLHLPSQCCPNLRETIPGGLGRPACLQFSPRFVTAQQIRR